MRLVNLFFHIDCKREYWAIYNHYYYMANFLPFSTYFLLLFLSVCNAIRTFRIYETLKFMVALASSASSESERSGTLENVEE